MVLTSESSILEFAFYIESNTFLQLRTWMKFILRLKLRIICDAWLDLTIESRSLCVCILFHFQWNILSMNCSKYNRSSWTIKNIFICSFSIFLFASWYFVTIFRSHGRLMCTDVNEIVNWIYDTSHPLSHVHSIS